jgi:hypothetical protein
LLLGTLALLAAGAGDAAGATPNAGQPVNVTVYKQDGSTSHESITIGQLAGCPQYTGDPITLEPQGTAATTGSQTWSLAQVLGCLSPTAVDVTNVTSAVVHHSDADQTPEDALSQSDLQSPSDFPDHSQSPIITTDGTNILYFRPWRGGSDNNGRDDVEDPNPQPFILDVFEGPALTVSVTASQTNVSTGGSVTFTPSVTGGTTSNLSYSWSFDGGAPPSTQTAPTVTFSSSGAYRVSVEVTDTSSGSGGSASVPITVTSSSPPPPTTTGSNPSPTQGTNTNPNAPTHGQTGGKHNGSGNSPSGKQPGGNPASGKHHQTHTTPTKTPTREPATQSSTTTTTTTAGASGGTGGSGGSGPSSTGTQTGSSTQTTTTPATPARHRVHSRAPHQRPTPTQGPNRVIHGLLISDVHPVSPNSSPLVTAASAPPSAAPVIRRGERASILPLVASAVAILLLLTLGAARELRGRGSLRFGS